MYDILKTETPELQIFFVTFSHVVENRRKEFKGKKNWDNLWNIQMSQVLMSHIHVLKLRLK